MPLGKKNIFLISYKLPDWKKSRYNACPAFQPSRVFFLEQCEKWPQPAPSPCLWKAVFPAGQEHQAVQLRGVRTRGYAAGKGGSRSYNSGQSLCGQAGARRGWLDPWGKVNRPLRGGCRRAVAVEAEGKSQTRERLTQEQNWRLPWKVREKVGGRSWDEGICHSSRRAKAVSWRAGVWEGRRGAATITLRARKGDEPWRNPSSGSLGGRDGGRTGKLERPLGGIIDARCDGGWGKGMATPSGWTRTKSRVWLEGCHHCRQDNSIPLGCSLFPLRLPFHWVPPAGPSSHSLGERGQCCSPGQRGSQGSARVLPPSHVSTSAPWSPAGGLCCPPAPPPARLVPWEAGGQCPGIGHACRGQTAALTLMASPKPETLGAAHWRLPGPRGHMLGPGSELWLLLGEAGSSTCLGCLGKNEDRQVLVDPVHPGSLKAFQRCHTKSTSESRLCWRPGLRSSLCCRRLFDIQPCATSFESPVSINCALA